MKNIAKQSLIFAGITLGCSSSVQAGGRLDHFAVLTAEDDRAISEGDVEKAKELFEVGFLNFMRERMEYFSFKKEPVDDDINKLNRLKESISDEGAKCFLDGINEKNTEALKEVQKECFDEKTDFTPDLESIKTRYGKWLSSFYICNREEGGYAKQEKNDSKLERHAHIQSLFCNYLRIAHSIDDTLSRDIVSRIRQMIDERSVGWAPPAVFPLPDCIDDIKLYVAPEGGSSKRAVPPLRMHKSELIKELASKKGAGL